MGEGADHLEAERVALGRERTHLGNRHPRPVLPGIDLDEHPRPGDGRRERAGCYGAVHAHPQVRPLAERGEPRGTRA